MKLFSVMKNSLLNWNEYQWLNVFYNILWNFPYTNSELRYFKRLSVGIVTNIWQLDFWDENQFKLSSLFFLNLSHHAVSQISILWMGIHKCILHKVGSVFDTIRAPMDIIRSQERAKLFLINCSKVTPSRGVHDVKLSADWMVLVEGETRGRLSCSALKESSCQTEHKIWRWKKILAVLGSGCWHTDPKWKDFLQAGRV